MKIFILPLFAIYLQICATAQIPDAGNILSSHNQKSKARTLEEIPNTDVIEEATPKKSPSSNSDVSVFIREFKIEGNPKLFSISEITKKLDPLLFQDLTLIDLNKALQTINNSYRKLGYFLAYAYFPQQDITQGIVTIKIIEGLLDSSDSGISVNRQTGSTRLQSQQLAAIVAYTNKPGLPLNRDHLERAILLLGDFPEVKASVNLEPGTEFATTKLIIEATESSLLNPWISITNTGNRYTGSILGEAGVRSNNLISFGDRITTSWKKSLNEKGFDLGFIDYSIMATKSGLRIGMKGTWMQYELGKSFEILNAKGTVTALSLYADYPLIRKSKLNLRTHLSYGFSLYEDESLGIQLNKKQIRSLQTGFSFDETDNIGLGGFTYAHAFLQIGDNNIRNDASRIIDQSKTGPNTHGNFQKLSYYLKRIQRLPNSFLLTTKASGQWAPMNLDSSEKLHIGGVYGVRAYSASEGVGDSGINLSLESERILFDSSIFGEVRAKAFYDWGHIKQYTDGDNIPLLTPMTYNLSGWGLGLSFKDADRFNLNLIYSQRIGNNPSANPSTGNDADGTQTKSRFWFTFQYNF